MKKHLGMILIFLSGWMYFMLVAVIASELFYVLKNNTIEDMILMLVAIILAIPCLALIELGFRMREGQYALKNGKRVKMILFCTLLMIFMDEYSDIHRSSSTSASIQVMQTILMFCVICTAVVYLKRYFRYSVRKNSVLRKIRQGSIHADRRFTLLVEQVIPDKKNNATAVCGFVHGMVRVHDKVFAYIPGDKYEAFEVVRIRTGDQNKKFAENEACGVYLGKYMEEGEIPVYTTITNIHPYSPKKGEINAESPVLRSLVSEYPEFLEDHHFMSLLIYQIVHARYIVPVQLTEEYKDWGNPTIELQKGTNFAFPQVTQKKEPTKRLMPVYTDWDAVYQWDHFFDEVPCGAVIMKFPDMINIAKQQFDGITINPFGPQPFFMSEQFIQSVTNLPGYREEFLGENVDVETEKDV